MANIIDTFGLPEAVVNAIRNDQYDPGVPLEGTAGIYTPSSLGTPPQIRHLYALHTDEIEEEAVTRVWALFGSAMHYILELGAEQVGEEVAEQRLYAKLGPVTPHGMYTISGLIDNRTTTAINDYKVTSAWTILNGGRDEWDWQLNVYGWLCRQNGLPVDTLRIYALLRDWSWRRAIESDKYPQTPIIEWPIKTMTDAAIEQYMRDRIRAHEAAKAGDVDECTDEDRWAKPSTWVLRKAGNQRAVKTEDTLANMARYCEDRKIAAVTTNLKAGFGTVESEFDEGFDKGDYYVIERVGEQVRCARYCPVVQWCEQAKSLKVEPTMRAYGRV